MKGYWVEVGGRSVRRRPPPRPGPLGRATGPLSRPRSLETVQSPQLHVVCEHRGGVQWKQWRIAFIVLPPNARAHAAPAARRLRGINGMRSNVGPSSCWAADSTAYSCVCDMGLTCDNLQVAMPPDGLSCQAGCTRVGRAGPQQNQLHTGCNLHSAKSQEEGHWKYQFVLGGAGAIMATALKGTRKVSGPHRMSCA